MIINNLEQMEKIVAKNKFLKWDGWSVVSFYPSNKARTSKYGAIVDGKWSIVKIFNVDKKGWDIPDKFLT